VKTLAIVGFGPASATAVAEKFGSQGFSLALIGRNEERLAAGVASLKTRGIEAFAFSGDAGDESSIRSAIRSVRSKMGPITAIYWNAFATGAGDVLAADAAELHGIFDVAVFGLIAATQEALADLKQNNGAILIQNGGFGTISPEVDAYVTSSRSMGLALGNAAKNKLVGLLSARLKDDGVFVGEVMVDGGIKGTAYAGDSGIDPKTIAEKYWTMYQSRNEVRAVVG
jgi:NAD(P)-dependent dehydrogenase (short-subunit alcohol dehydrogenase family)